MMSPGRIKRWTNNIAIAATLVGLAGWTLGCGDDAGAGSGARNAGSDGVAGNNGADSNGWSGNNATVGNNGQANNNGVATNNGGTGNQGATNNGSNDGGNTNVNLGGSQDFGYFRSLLDANRVPLPSDIDAAGFFAEHHTPLPEPTCGERICLQPMLGVMDNLMNGANCTMLQVGLNSPIVADEDNRPPLTLAVVVDVSGSMQADGKINFVRDGLAKLINELNDDDQIALITYSTDVATPYPMGPVRGMRNDLQDIADNLRAEGSTNLYGGLEAGYLEVFEHYDSGRQNRVILLSDGEPTAGVTDPAEITTMSRAYNSDGVGLTTVGLGTDFNFALMRGLAEQADGNYYFLENAGAVDEVFTQELSYFTVPVAFDLQVNVRAGSHYDFARAFGTPFWQDTEEGGKLDVPSVFLAHRVSHDDVTPDGGRRGGGSALLIELLPKDVVDQDLTEATVATVDIQFREPGTDRIVTDTIEVGYPHNPWETLATGFFENEIVTKSFVMLNVLAALEIACDLFHSGEPIEAVGLLQRLIAAAADYEDGANGGEGDVDIQFDIQLMEDLIDVMLINGAQAPVDSEIPEDPWPAD